VLAFALLFGRLALYLWARKKPGARMVRTTNLIVWAQIAAGPTLLLFTPFPESSIEGELLTFTASGAFAGFAAVWYFGSRRAAKAIDADHVTGRESEDRPARRRRGHRRARSWDRGRRPAIRRGVPADRRGGAMRQAVPGADGGPDGGRPRRPDDPLAAAGTGVARGAAGDIAPKLVSAAAEYPRQDRDSRVQRVYVLAYRRSDLRRWMNAANACNLLERKGGSVEVLFNREAVP
jgi:hypothetical protein